MLSQIFTEPLNSNLSLSTVKVKSFKFCERPKKITLIVGQLWSEKFCDNIVAIYLPQQSCFVNSTYRTSSSNDKDASKNIRKP